jgi:hypothetical protein
MNNPLQQAAYVMLHRRGVTVGGPTDSPFDVNS